MPLIKCLIFILCVIFPLCLHAAKKDDDPCRGTGMMLALVNRPSLSVSPCTVPPRNTLVELGVLYADLVSGGEAIIGPFPSLRMGLNKDSEFILYPPNYIHQTVSPTSGTSPTFFGLKGRFFYNKKYMVSIDVDLSPPSGSYGFGSPEVQGIVTPIFYVNVSKKISMQLQTGVSHFCDPAFTGGNCYNSFNPIYLLNYNVSKKVAAYYELAEQTKTSFANGSGMINGLGLLYLYKPAIVFDVEYYHRIYGQLSNIDDYIGVGVSLLFR